MALHALAILIVTHLQCVVTQPSSPLHCTPPSLHPICQGGHKSVLLCTLRPSSLELWQALLPFCESVFSMAGDLCQLISSSVSWDEQGGGRHTHLCISIFCSSIFGILLGSIYTVDTIIAADQASFV
jgi:hypothetical protein